MIRVSPHHVTVHHDGWSTVLALQDSEGRETVRVVLSWMQAGKLIDDLMMESCFALLRMGYSGRKRA